MNKSKGPTPEDPGVDNTSQSVSIRTVRALTWPKHICIQDGTVSCIIRMGPARETKSDVEMNDDSFIF